MPEPASVKRGDLPLQLSPRLESIEQTSARVMPTMGKGSGDLLASRKYEAQSFGASRTMEQRIADEVESRLQDRLRAKNARQPDHHQSSARPETHQYEDLLSKYNELLYRFNTMNQTQENKY